MEIYEDPIKYIKIYIIAYILPHNAHKSQDRQNTEYVDDPLFNYLYIK